jgi:hypothetical protein
MNPVIEALGARTVGTVEVVSANIIVVLLDPEAPQATALNTGRPAGFPRINGYLLIPNESGATVGVITKVEIERSPFPKRRGMQDFGLVDLPFPARKVMLTPLGTLVSKLASGGADVIHEIRRGVDVFPSVGDPVHLPTEAQLRAIVQGESGETSRRILLGHCPTAAYAPVYVDPDKLFGRHLAVLGNTGAGKSCSVAGLIRWSLEAAQQERGRSGPSNVRFIVLDPNGEYARAFQGLGARIFQVGPPAGSDAQPLKVPAWLWNGEEWAAFTGAAPGVQRPILFDALRRLRAGAGTPDTFETRVRGRVRRYINRLNLALQAGEHQGPGKREGVAQALLNLAEDFRALLPECSDSELKTNVEAAIKEAENAENAARGQPRQGCSGHWHNDFSDSAIENVRSKLKDIAQKVGLSIEEPISEDAPLPFSVRELPAFVEALAADVSGRDMAQFVNSLTLRIRGLFAPGPLSAVLDPNNTAAITLDKWLNDYVGQSGGGNGPLAILDLSLVPSEVIHIVVAVLARMVFEAVQRYRRAHGSVLPTVLVLEEAHTFVHRDLRSDSAPAPGRVCCRVFERIAREGRKFGLGLVLASQRPSEMSETVLAQCNTFLLHRLVNDRDQELVRKLVPDGHGDLLRELPSLPSRRAILLGWGAPAPVLVEVKELPDGHRPHSPDPRYWDVWTGKESRQVDWSEIAKSWQGQSAQQKQGSTQRDATQDHAGNAQ